MRKIQNTFCRAMQKGIMPAMGCAGFPAIRGGAGEITAEYGSTEENGEKRDPLGLHDDRGVGVVEIILILVVLIALVAIFKTQLTSLVTTIFNAITKNANNVIK